MKTLYMCQASTGLFAFSYAESDEEAGKFFEELYEQYNPGWLNCELRYRACSEGWGLPGKDDNFDDVQHMPFSFDEVQAQLQGYKDRREKRKLKDLKKRFQNRESDEK